MNSYPTLGSLSSDALLLIFWLSLPALAVATAVGVLVGLVQSITQIQDQALPYGAKIIGVGLVMIVAMPWGSHEVSRFFEHALSYIAAGRLQ